MLDLFSGTGSVAKVYRDHGYEVITLDSDPRFKADIQTNILEWDPRDYPPGYFDTIFAAPPCTEYSIAMTSRARDLDTADSIVRCTLRIIAYFEQKTWVIENPATGLLKS